MAKKRNSDKHNKIFVRYNSDNYILGDNQQP